MASLFVGLAAGLLFGAGLVISGMIGPAKVLAFLDIAGDWDPSLAFVMAAAIPVTALGFKLARRRDGPLRGDRFSAPTRTAVDGKLILGALLFGAGWGLVGYCPGPALAALVYGQSATWIFVVAMAVGMVAHDFSSWRRNG
ncbi:membrane protein [Skermanella stibiiresistens SB22]|uniref:Membrane protein n=1 Tax=Skermanella stibiiresistens SB22 TaxID=1385369 RepID=W9HC00_9PROT|nr:YeeE/YedE family protein [Skermanella stibiiresistens]EWY42212.1 membrane protein [Skermanella stibiiresistens SB22]